jgi:hypothetical protein
MIPLGLKYDAVVPAVSNPEWGIYGRRRVLVQVQ